MEHVDWNAKVKEAFDRTEFMAISTIGSDSCWTNPVQFGYNEKADLFFISMLDAQHVRNILTNGRVSGAIFKTERFAGSRDVLGLQFASSAQLLSDRGEIDEAARHYYGRDPRKLDPKKHAAEHIEKGEWYFFKITPTELWCFDSRIFDEKRVQVPLDSLRIALNY